MTLLTALRIKISLQFLGISIIYVGQTNEQDR